MFILHDKYILMFNVISYLEDKIYTLKVLHGTLFLYIYYLTV